MNIKELNALIDVDYILGILGLPIVNDLGDEVQTVCPFHSDTNPSLNISRSKRVYHCFGCSSAGNIIGLVADSQEISFKQAADNLAKIFGVELTASVKLNTSEEETIKWLLAQRKKEPKAQAPLPEQRVAVYGKDRYRIKTMPYWKDTNFPDTVLDFFELGVKNDRLFIPIRDEKDKLVGYSTRSPLTSPEEGRYLHMKGFQKTFILYNFNNVIKLLEEGQCDVILLTEGFSDVWNAFSHGFMKAVAVMGKEVTQEQIDLLLKYTYRVVLCLDADPSGKDGMKKFYNQTKNLVDIEYMKLPNGRDLGSLSKEEFWEFWNNKKQITGS
jgi:DNA primase